MSAEEKRSSGISAQVDGPLQRPAPGWNIVSVAAPILGLLIGFIVAVIGIPGDSAWGWGGLLVAALVIAVSLVVGLIAASVALLRSERRWGLTSLGFAINLAPVVVILGRMILRH